MVVDTLVNVFAAGGKETTVSSPAQDVERLRGARLLLAEDNAINQQIAVEILEGAGAKVTVVDNGREAVERLARAADGSFDVVLMDLQMPEMDGLQATRTIRSDQRFARLPIVAMTAHATSEERQRCLDAGMNDHVAKPIDPEQLIETLVRFIRGAASKSVAAPHPASTPGEPAPSNIDLMSIDGLDARGALARIGGNRKKYEDLLRTFVAEHEAVVGQVDDLIARGELANVQNVAHSLKGVAANLGATRVAHAAGALERAIRDNSPAVDIASARQDTADALAALIERLRAVLDAPGSRTEEAGTASAAPETMPPREAATRLASMLSEFDPSAATFVDAHRTALRTVIGEERWSQFEALVREYAFDASNAQLADALKTFATV
jgi:two-component system sensor histidine kinase/response regulator